MLSQMAPKSHVGRLVAATLELARLSRRVSFPQIAEPIRELFSDLNSAVLAIYRRSAQRKPRTGKPSGTTRNAMPANPRTSGSAPATASAARSNSKRPSWKVLSLDDGQALAVRDIVRVDRRQANCVAAYKSPTRFARSSLVAVLNRASSPWIAGPHLAPRQARPTSTDWTSVQLCTDRFWRVVCPYQVLRWEASAASFSSLLSSSRRFLAF
jgi:hypothetical protein